MERVVIYIDGSENDALSLSCAVTYSARVGAALDVVHVREPAQVMVTDFAVGSAVYESTEHREASRNRARAAYDAVCGPYERVHWHETDEDLIEVIRQRGVLTDLTILERLHADEGPEALTFNTVVFETGGPVMIAPPSETTAIARTAAIGWSATAASARAVRAALPILKTADQVYLLTNTENPRAKASELAEYLEHHGVKSETYPFMGVRLTARARGRAVLRAAKDVGADLLVFGAHGTGGLDALFGLGRATRKVVTAAPMPVLLHS